LRNTKTSPQYGVSHEAPSLTSAATCATICETVDRLCRQHPLRSTVVQITGCPEAPTAPSKASPAPLRLTPPNLRAPHHLYLDHTAKASWGDAIWGPSTVCAGPGGPARPSFAGPPAQAIRNWNTKAWRLNAGGGSVVNLCRQTVSSPDNGKLAEKPRKFGPSSKLSATIVLLFRRPRDRRRSPVINSIKTIRKRLPPGIKHGICHRLNSQQRSDHPGCDRQTKAQNRGGGGGIGAGLPSRCRPPRRRVNSRGGFRPKIANIDFESRVTYFAYPGPKKRPADQRHHQIIGRRTHARQRIASRSQCQRLLLFSECLEHRRMAQTWRPGGASTCRFVCSAGPRRIVHDRGRYSWSAIRLLPGASRACYLTGGWA